MYFLPLNRANRRCSVQPINSSLLLGTADTKGLPYRILLLRYAFTQSSVVPLIEITGQLLVVVYDTSFDIYLMVLDDHFLWRWVDAVILQVLSTKMISLTNPFRAQQYHTSVVPSGQGSQLPTANAPPPVTSSTPTSYPNTATILTRNQSWQSSTTPHDDESKLSSLLSACEAGTHSFARDEDAGVAGVGWIQPGGTGYGIQERLRRMSSGKLMPLCRIVRASANGFV